METLAYLKNTGAGILIFNLDYDKYFKIGQFWGILPIQVKRINLNDESLNLTLPPNPNPQIFPNFSLIVLIKLFNRMKFVRYDFEPKVTFQYVLPEHVS